MNADIERLRARIDALDARAIGVLAERFRLVSELARLKQEAGVPIEDAAREGRLRESHDRAARQEGLDPEIADAIFVAVLNASKRLQARASGENGSSGDTDGA